MFKNIKIVYEKDSLGHEKNNIVLNCNVNPETLGVYKHNIDVNLQSTKIPWNALQCEKN